MNKEITCRINPGTGKPEVNYKECFVPKRGSIIVCGYYSDKECHAMYIVGDKLPYYQARVYLKSNNSDPKIGKLSLNNYYSVEWNYIREALPEEIEVMFYVLDENGYDLINGEVVKKRWIPKMKEQYWYPFIDTNESGAVPVWNERCSQLDTKYKYCFKTKEACRSVCDKINELLITLMQE